MSASRVSLIVQVVGEAVRRHEPVHVIVSEWIANAEHRIRMFGGGSRVQQMAADRADRTLVELRTCRSMYASWRAA